MAEVIQPGDTREHKSEEASNVERRGFIEHRTWKIAYRHEVRKNANFIGGRFVLAIKDEVTEEEV